MIQYRIVLIILLILNPVVFSQTTISIDKVFGIQPAKMLVPVRVEGSLSNVKSISLQFSYDVNSVSFNHEASDPQSGISNISLPGSKNYFVSVYNGVINFSWVYTEGISFDGKMFDLDFSYKSGFSEIRLLSASAKDIQGKKLSVSLVNGSISQNTNPAIKLFSPNGGELLEVFGAPVNISWSSIYITNVKLEYSTDNGTTWNSIIENYEALKDIYLWSVPQTINSSECKIRISDQAPGGVSDESDAVFTINSTPVISLTTPNGGEELKVGGIKTIKWTYKNIENIKIEYSKNASAGAPLWHTVIASVPAKNNSYEWVIPDAVSADCKLRVTDIANPATVYDLSNAAFKIHTDPINVTIPHTINAKLEFIGKVMLDRYWWWTQSEGWNNDDAHYDEDGIEFDHVDTLAVYGTIPVNIGWLTSLQYLEITLNYDPNILNPESLIPAIPELGNLSYSYNSGVLRVIWYNPFI